VFVLVMTNDKLNPKQEDESSKAPAPAPPAPAPPAPARSNAARALPVPSRAAAPAKAKCSRSPSPILSEEEKSRITARRNIMCYSMEMSSSDLNKEFDEMENDTQPSEPAANDIPSTSSHPTDIPVGALLNVVPVIPDRNTSKVNAV